MFFILSFIFCLAAIVITLKILIGYNPEFSFKFKAFIASCVVFAWFCPAFSGVLRRLRVLPDTLSTLITQSLYVIFITAFFLLCLLMIRDIFWIYGYWIAKRLKKASPAFDPMNPAVLKKANLAAVMAAFALSGYALYEGIKFPEIKETTLVTAKIDHPFRIVALTDTHITPATSVSYLEKIVATVDGLKPDIVVLVGDIIDARPKRLEPQMDVLKKLGARYGVFVTLGNHEFYHGSVEWEKKFRDMGLFYLANEGLMLNGANVYVAGLPDPQLLMINDQTMKGIRRTLKSGREGAFKVFLSHSPRFIERLNKNLIDLQISGHTHGGQIFPFHLLVKRFNGFVAGLYDVNGMKLYISRGVKGWGPPMRLFAPSEISVINLVPEKKD